MQREKPATDPRLLALFERIIKGEDGVYAADIAAGLARGTLSRWTTRTDIKPGAENLRKLAASLGQKYGFTTAQVLAWGGYAGTPDLPPDPALDPQLRHPMIVFRVDQRIPAEGTWPMADEYPVKTERKDIWELTVKGDCMLPVIADGDLVWIDPTVPAKVGHIVAVYLDGSWTLKRLRGSNGDWLLIPDNPAYEAVEVPKHDVRVLGVVIKILKTP